MLNLWIIINKISYTHTMKNDKVVVGITHGDVNGISYEVIIKSLIDNRIMDFCVPVIYGSPKVAVYHRKALNINNFSFNHITSVQKINTKRPNIINCVDDSIKVEFGKITKAAGKASLDALESSINDFKQGEIDVIVTAPINKYNTFGEQNIYSGHTEFFADSFDSASNSLMLMVSENLRVAVVTNHIAISDIPDAITKDLIKNKLRILNESLKKDFLIQKPKIAVMGLNPHLGDNGMIGKEEQDVIIPAVKEAFDEGIIALGPYAADGFFGSGSFKDVDAVLAMYHDQGLTPFKALTSDEGVNYTAGLPVVRTSPNHGTGFDIVGKNKASENSFRNAVMLACDIYKNRKYYEEINKNPLKITFNETEEPIS